MAELKIEKHKWQPNFKDETWVIDKRRQEEFQITLKQGEDIEIALTHTDNDNEDYYSFVNGQHTIQGGTHQAAFGAEERGK